jgi:hypothetical protein
MLSGRPSSPTRDSGRRPGRLLPPGTIAAGRSSDRYPRGWESRHFTVTRVDQFSKSRFPSRGVYGAIDHAGLRLTTCGGTYDAARRRYLDNVIVFAKLEAVRESGGR